ncbi:MAG TPA: type IV pilus modification protein PilV [Usitatibacter sp.]|nr:type IV pilus modification protein PilV [Usitatibacter sp.]
MIARHAPQARHSQEGTSMIEVLVAIVIVVVGLLGLAGLQSRAALAEMESFQRAQALVLLQDMADRLNANRKNSMSYVTSTPVGTGRAIEDCVPLNGAARDLCEWNNALLGASETQGSSKIGAMLGARGCVTVVSPNMPRRFVVSVVWQGFNPTASPGATSCGQGQYDAADLTRRAVTANVTIGCLQNDPVSLACLTP